MAGTGTAHLRPVDEQTLVRAENLVVEHRLPRGGRVHAVSDVSLDIRRGETLGLVGESGCGKSSLARALISLPAPTSGAVQFDDQTMGDLSARELRKLRHRLQIIFQDPISSLNPRRRVRDIVAEGLSISGAERPYAPRVDAALEAVGLDPDVFGDRRPGQLSGGQCQRVSLARAVVLEPDLIVCDEPVSALDVSVQAQILNLVEEMKRRFGLTLLFIAHDLGVVKSVSDRVAVMYLGKLCEIAPVEDLYDRPRHPYTVSLLASVPGAPATEGQTMLEGDPPSPADPPAGCRFHTRCVFATERCKSEEPQVRELAAGHFVACHHASVDGMTVPASEQPEPAEPATAAF
ncbi:ABC transporter ATP-binding protein [Nocardioides sp. cx-169]|uniref:ABC transporter ATP-binding protein n=1 Tax=Nocardioides sp. cx-169 TaxID=2899080 RepID=UPI001E55D83E|nr:ABC transporter ATP-binding protein [Nocardioides sp. cx-169]MCD4533075.1 ABC transporter ATP-binding protein [Nocardioides sp. cx-169]